MQCKETRNYQVALSALFAFFILCSNHAVAGVVDYPKRYSFEDYAERKGVSPTTIIQRFAATHVIRCGGQQASAQVTASINIITTSAHLFVNRKTCEIERTADTCEITFTTASGLKKFKGLETVDHGYKKTLDAKGRCPEQGLGWGNDWAILRVNNPLAVDAIKKETRPYLLPSLKSVHKTKAMIAVHGAALDYFKLIDGKKVYPRHVQDCSVRGIAPRPSTGDDGSSVVETDCDTGKLSSGGSLLRAEGHADTLVGIQMGSYETDQELKLAASEGRANVRPYKEGSWAGLYVSVDGEFLRALQRAVGIPEEWTVDEEKEN